MKYLVFMVCFFIPLFASAADDEVTEEAPSAQIETQVSVSETSQEVDGTKIDACGNGRVTDNKAISLYYYQKFHEPLLVDLRKQVVNESITAGNYVTMLLNYDLSKTMLQSYCNPGSTLKYHILLGTQLEDARFVIFQIDLLSDHINKERDLITQTTGSGYILKELRSARARFVSDLNSRKEMIISILEATQNNVQWDDVKDIFHENDYPFIGLSY